MVEADGPGPELSLQKTPPLSLQILCGFWVSVSGGLSLLRCPHRSRSRPLKRDPFPCGSRPPPFTVCPSVTPTVCPGPCALSPGPFVSGRVALSLSSSRGFYPFPCLVCTYLPRFQSKGHPSNLSDTTYHGAPLGRDRLPIRTRCGTLTRPRRFLRKGVKTKDLHRETYPIPREYSNGSMAWGPFGFGLGFRSVRAGVRFVGPSSRTGAGSFRTLVRQNKGRS